MTLPCTDIKLHNACHIYACTNHGYMDYTKNFLSYLKLIPRTWPFTLYCMDLLSEKELLEYVQHIGLTNVFVISFVLPDYKQEFRVWGQPEYKKLVYYRYEVLSRVFENQTVKSAIHLDTDIVILHDPIDLVLRTLQSMPDVDLLGQCDEGRLNCSSTKGCPNVCLGVVCFRNTPLIRGLIAPRRWGPLIQKYSGDQEYLNKTLPKDKKASLPSALFIHPPKHGLYNATKTMTYHFNYLVGNKKKEYMKKYGFWSILEDTKSSSS